MPSGKTHDAMSFLLTAPVIVVAYLLTRDSWLTAVVAGAFLFGSLMFGPDLDTSSKQYSRWRIFRFLWFPYRSFFKHRSMWSHGLIFGTLLRVVYFMGVATLAAFLTVYAYANITGNRSPAILDFASTWTTLRGYSDSVLGVYGVVGLFVGMWLGAAGHTLTDLAISYIRTGRARL